MGLNFEGLKATIDWNRSQKPFDEEQLEKNLCPFDDWKLKVNKKGQRSCPVCGRIYDV